MENENNIANNVMKKMYLQNGVLSDLNNYGIYDYFKYNDNIYRSKLIAVIRDDQYMISTGHADRCDHFGMHIDIEERIGRYDCFLGSAGNELNIFVDYNLSVNQLSTLIDVFNELKLYYLDTGVDKDICFIGSEIEDKFSKFKKCSDIDEILQLLKNMMIQLKSKNNSRNPWDCNSEDWDDIEEVMENGIDVVDKNI